MSFYNRGMATRAKAEYSKGTRIKVIDISDGSYPKAIGQTGTVIAVDDIGQIHCQMDNGTRATVCAEYGDSFYKVTEEG